MPNLLIALGLRPTKAGRESKTPDSESEGGTGHTLPEALAQWHEERRRIVDSLKGIAARAAQSRHKDAKAALNEIQAVVKRLLGAEPRTLQDVQELEGWLREDQVVADLDELECKIRSPLLFQLARIRASLGQ